MAYPTICDECLAADHDHCGQSKLRPESEQIATWNDEHPGDLLVGGGFCVCGHGAPETLWVQSVRESLMELKK